VKSPILSRNTLSIVIVSLVLSVAATQSFPLFAVVSGTTCTPDFSITVSPTALTIVKGGPVANVGVGFTSICGLSGTINFGVRGVTPQATVTCNNKGVCTSNGLLFKQCCYDLPLNAGGSTGNHITVNATKNTLANTYQVRITGTDIQGGCCYGITHSANVSITVNSCCVPNFTISANPTSIKVAVGQIATSAITATGSGGFSGTIYYSGVISPSSVPSESCNLQPAQPTLTSTATSVTSQLTSSFANSGTYTITETASPYSGTPTRTLTVTVTVTNH
jgi:hypothetical protein